MIDGRMEVDNGNSGWSKSELTRGVSRPSDEGISFHPQHINYILRYHYKNTKMRSVLFFQ